MERKGAGWQMVAWPNGAGIWISTARPPLWVAQWTEEKHGAKRAKRDTEASGHNGLLVLPAKGGQMRWSTPERVASPSPTVDPMSYSHSVATSGTVALLAGMGNHESHREHSSEPERDSQGKRSSDLSSISRLAIVDGCANDCAYWPAAIFDSWMGGVRISFQSQDGSAALSNWVWKGYLEKEITSPGPG